MFSQPGTSPVAPATAPQSPTEEHPDEKLSKVEKAVQVSKSLAEDGDEIEPPLPPLPKKSLKEKVVGALHHYWVGTKLLAYDFSISARLLLQILKGKELSRRERKQLLRTTSDLFRLVPFIVIVIVPFAELALPFLLTLFPNMLPSTFEDKYEKEEKKKKILQARLETARFLQETLEEIALVSKTPENAKLTNAFSDFFRKIRTTGQQASNKDILLFSKLFRDELTLDNLSRPQIVGMCKYMNINAFGTTTYLRSQLRKRFKELKEDDMQIQKEGVESLNVVELQQACQSRGMRIIGVSSNRLRKELQQWIDLRLKEGVPGSLLVLSRAFMIQDTVVQPSSEDLSSALQATLSSLPDEVIKEVHLDVSEIEGKSENEKKLDIIKEQEELIREEKEEDEAAQKSSVEQLSVQERIERAHALAEMARGDAQESQKVLKELNSISREGLTKEQVADLADAVLMLSKSTIVAEEREDFEELKEDFKEFMGGVEDLKKNPDVELSKASTTLSKKVQNMLHKIEGELKKVEDEGNSLKSIHPDFGGEVSFSDIEKALSALKNKPINSEGLKQLLEALDANKDGRISIEELEKYADSVEEMEGVGGLKKGEDQATQQKNS